MKDFRTVLKMSPSGTPMDLQSRIFTHGSCFADAIGGRLATHKLQVMVNPFGATYNPASIHKTLKYTIFNESVADHTFVQNHEIFLNYDFHSAFSSLSKAELVRQLTNSIGTAHYFLKDTDWLLLTYGTAWVYNRKETGEIVANCHKLPGTMFSKSLMTVANIESSFLEFYKALKRFNPNVKIILTVSPVRHLKDTLELNAVSKSVLRLACHQLALDYDDVEYFPAYEVMLDDLRDYRFYKSDMLHPTAEAETYIWERFGERYFSAELRAFAEKWQAILSALQHRPFHPAASAHQQFLRDLLEKLDELSGQVDVETEISMVKQQLINKHHD